MDTRSRAGSGRRPIARRVLLIALTGWGQEDDLRRSRAAGFDHHLVKPPDVDKLRDLPVVLENIFYSISVAVMVMVGSLAFLLAYRPTDAALTIPIALGASALVAMLMVWWLLNSQPRLLSRFLTHAAVRDAEDRVFRFTAARKATVAQILGLEFVVSRRRGAGDLFPAAPARRPRRADALERPHPRHVERLITIAFKFVPLRLGVDHIGAGSVAGLLGIGAATGSPSQPCARREICSGPRWAWRCCWEHGKKEKGLLVRAGPDGSG